MTPAATKRVVDAIRSHRAWRAFARPAPMTTLVAAIAVRARAAPANVDTGAAFVAARTMTASWVLSPSSATKLRANAVRKGPRPSSDVSF